MEENTKILIVDFSNLMEHVGFFDDGVTILAYGSLWVTLKGIKIRNILTKLDISWSSD